MNPLDLMLRWMHVFSAIALVGGTLFLYIVWLPSTRDLSDEQREESFAKLRRPWSLVVMTTTLLLLASGLFNAMNVIGGYEFAGHSYHALVLIKILLALGLFFLAARLAGRGQGAVRMRQKMSFWLAVNTLLAILLVGIAGYMKLTDRTVKPPPPTPVATAPAPSTR